MFNFRRRVPTEDEELVNFIKHHISELVSLSLEAKKRGITVWVRRGYTGDIFKPEQIIFREAYRTSTEKLG